MHWAGRVKVTNKTPKLLRRSGVFIANFENIQCLALLLVAL